MWQEHSLETSLVKVAIYPIIYLNQWLKGNTLRLGLKRLVKPVFIVNYSSTTFQWIILKVHNSIWHQRWSNGDGCYPIYSHWQQVFTELVKERSLSTLSVSSTDTACDRDLLDGGINWPGALASTTSGSGPALYALWNCSNCMFHGNMLRVSGWMVLGSNHRLEQPKGYWSRQ